MASAMHSVAQKILEFGTKPSIGNIDYCCTLHAPAVKPAVSHTLASLTGYGEKYSKDIVLETFQTYLMASDRNASQLKPTDANITQFMDFFLEQHEGAMPSGTDLEDEPEPEGPALC